MKASVDLITVVSTIVSFCLLGCALSADSAALAEGAGGGSDGPANLDSAAASVIATSLLEASKPVDDKLSASNTTTTTTAGTDNSDPVTTSSDASSTGGSSSTPMTPAADAEDAPAPTKAATNGTIPSGFGVDVLQNRGMIARMTYVLVGFSLLILGYFVFKAVRLRRAKSRTRKYGVLAENLDAPLVPDDSDEEVEVFEVNGSNLRGGRGSKGGNTAADRLLP